MTSTGTPAPSRAAGRPVWRAGLRAAVVAAAANTLVWLVGQLTPATWQVTTAGQTQDVLLVLPALASLVGIGAGTVALWALARFSWGVTAWTVLAVVVGLGSVVSPLGAAEDGWTGALLACMHVVCLVSALTLLRPAGRRPAS